MAAVIVLAIASPGSLAALAEPVARVIERLPVGSHTSLLRTAPPRADEAMDVLRRHNEDVDSGRAWFVNTHYGGFGGNVPPGAGHDVRRATSLERLRTLSQVRILGPTAAHRGEALRLHHALVTPDGGVLAYYGSGATEVMLLHYPAGGGRSLAFSRPRGQTTPEGKFVPEAAPLRAEEFTLGGQSLVWDPDPEPLPAPPSAILAFATWLFDLHPEGSALRWEAAGVSYSLYGRSLRREEAIRLYQSLRPLPPD